MNSAEMLSTIWNSEEIKKYRGFGKLSFPFCTESGRTAFFLFIESDRRDLLHLSGIFTEHEGRCVFESADWEISLDRLTEDAGERQGWMPKEREPIGAYAEYLDAMETLYTGFDRFAEAVFRDPGELSDEQLQSVTEYTDLLHLMSDQVQIACYGHCCPKFMEWCYDTSNYAQIMS